MNTLDVFSDYLWPFCWLAEPALLELTGQEPEIAVRWRAFELRPDPVPILDPKGDYLTRVWHDHVYPLAEKMNMQLRLPPMQPRSRLAHGAAKWAGRFDRFNEYHNALFRAFFQLGLDIGNIEVLEQLATDLGLDAAGLRIALVTNEFTGSVRQDQEEAGRIGVRAVPAYAAGGNVVATGVQTASRLRELIRLLPL